MPRAPWPALVVTALLLTTACAQEGPAGAAPTASGTPTPPEAPTGPVPPTTTGTPSAPSTPPSTPWGPAEGPVIEVAHTGGFATPELLASRLPLVSVHADGRVITPGPQIAVFPPPALPGLQVQHVDEDAVAVLVERALRAGVGGSDDLGSPPVADLPSTRFTVRAQDGTRVREVYALGAESPHGPPDDTLTPEQRAARAALQALVQELGDPASVLPEDAVGAQEVYVPEAVAGVVTAWQGPPDGPEPRPVPWPGPPLPGEPLEPRLGLSCVLAAGEQARAVMDAAAAADSLTPWVSEDGGRWSVALRPLLPHEQDCTDLLGW
ncbi:hypothetical protein [Kocuria sp. NPDC057446]|uniref:hypothetical protein n=1 Tax=Kocuria sp. NPDC057446 TaxID=3346137 RepID=UPI0036996155